MCNKQNIKVTEGNAFALLLPLKARTYTADGVPVDEDLNPQDLTDVVVKIGDTAYTYTLEDTGVQVVVPGTLKRGTYDVVLTGKHEGADIRAAWFELLTIVAWNYQSDVEQFLPGSPIIAPAAVIVSGALTDAELEALKEEYRERNAQLAQAIADAEAAKEHYDELAEQLTGVAQEQTLTDGVTAIREDISHIDIDTSTLAKQGTNPNATLSEVQEKIGTPSSGQAASLFGAIGQVALSAETLQSLADSWAAMVTNRQNMSGFVFNTLFNVRGVGDLLFNFNNIVDIHDTTTRTMNFAFNSAFNYMTGLRSVRMDALITMNAQQLFRNSIVKEIYFPNLITLGSIGYGFNNCVNLTILYLPSLTTAPTNNNTFSSSANLIDITFGAIPTDINISTWSPTNALNASSQTLLTDEDIAAGFTSNLQKLLYNIREHIAANLPVANNTITFSAAIKAAILADQPTADAFTNKNWTIA